jgi:disulfide bond formation protein DsbB
VIDDGVVTFLALLAVLCICFLLTTAVCAVVVGVRALTRRGEPATPAPSGRMTSLRDALGTVALSLAFAVALTTTLGSLYLSERLKLPPCKLCWYQRIAMYPQVLILGVAALRRDVMVKWYSVPLLIAGLGVATYHYALERFPDTVKFACTTDVACETVWIWKFHFLSIPGMAWVAFATIAVLVLLARTSRTAGSPISPTADEHS